MAFTKNDPLINRNGRPKKGFALADKLVSRDLRICDDGRTVEDHYLDQLYLIATGEKPSAKVADILSAINMIIDRKYGKALERIEQSYDDEDEEVSADTLEILARLKREQDARLASKAANLPPVAV